MELDASILVLLSKLGTDSHVARQMLHQGLEEALGLVKANKPPDLHALADDIMSKVMGSVSLLPSHMAAGERPGEGGWTGHPGHPSFAMTPGADLARPLEQEFALALTAGSSNRFMTPSSAPFSMPPVSTSTFAWSPARPQVSNWVATDLRTQDTAVRGTLLSLLLNRPSLR